MRLVLQRVARAEVRVDGEQKGKGWGRTKRHAEQGAARDALDNLYAGWDKKKCSPPRINTGRGPCCVPPQGSSVC